MGLLTHELLPAHEGLGRAVVSLLGELEYDLVVFVGDELLVSEGRSSDVAKKTLNALAVVGGNVQPSMHGKSVDFGGAFVL